MEADVLVKGLITVAGADEMMDMPQTYKCMVRLELSYSDPSVNMYRHTNSQPEMDRMAFNFGPSDLA